MQLTLWFWLRILGFVARHTSVARRIPWLRCGGQLNAAPHAVRNRAGMPGPSQAIDAKAVYSQQFHASEVHTWSTYSTVRPAPVGGAGRGEYARHHHCARAVSVAGISAGFWTVGEPAAARACLVSKAHAADLPTISCCG